VNVPIVITGLGVFDNNGDGNSTLKAVGIFNRDTQASVFTVFGFVGTGAPLVNGDRIATFNGVTLPPGHYSVVAVGFNNTDLNGNSTISGFMASTENTGGGLITFVGTGRYDNNTTLDFPTIVPPGTPSNVFNAGTFTFQAFAAPTLTKTITTPNGQFNPGDTGTVTFTLSNPNAAPLTGLAFTDTLPNGLVISTPNGQTGSCGGGTITAPAGGNTISLTGATLAGNSSCTFSVNVTDQVFNGTVTNTTSSVTSNEAPAGAPATATETTSPLFFMWFFLES
jgi:uncharacterized repeat protein (TIGR01451 family)